MNKNSRQRKVAQWKANKKSGGFPKPVFKKKKQPFPQEKDAGLSITKQREMFYGYNAMV